MSIQPPFQDVQLPNDWAGHIKSALIHAISLAHTAITYSRGWAVDSTIQRVRMAGELDAARNEIALLKEEISIKDARMARMPPAKRAFYTPTERLAILELRAARGWNVAETAKAFMVEPQTITAWMGRLPREEDRLLQCAEPINQYPHFVRYIVQRLKTLCPTMGKRRIAQTLARAGLQLSATTVWRILKEDITPIKPEAESSKETKTTRVVTARYPNHVWHVDMTTVPTTGFWTTWLPFTLPQVWPFCWWVVIILDHFSRAVIGFAVFKKQPTSEEVRQFFATAISRVGAAPKYLISDQGSQFTSGEFKAWCKAEPRNIRQRFGAVGQYGSIAVIERLMRSVKRECIAQLPVVPMKLRDMRRELSLYFDWYNLHRPHQAIEGRVPMDEYFGTTNDPPRLETRGKNGLPLQLDVSRLDDRRHLPIIELRQAA